MRIFRNPRVYIYLCGILLTVFFLKWHERELRAQAQQNASVAAPAQNPNRTPLAPVAKDAELASPKTLPRPKLYLFGDTSELDIPLLREHLQKQCFVLQVQGSAEVLKKAFELEALPVAILYTHDNQELARFLPPLDIAAIEQKTTQVLAQQPANP
ncbi:MAG: hypothetical protein IJJ26_00505 [Victivallales bacterium]|nr:hypothetical protein [Victivallales bacterium]